MIALKRLISIKSLLFLSTMLSLMITNRGISQIDTGKLITKILRFQPTKTELYQLAEKSILCLTN